MKYCYNCGAEIFDKDQKFCIKCSTDLMKYKKKRAKYNKDSRKKYQPLKGESYNDYLERINSPIRHKIASKEEIEEESLAYINYKPHKKNDEINYPKSETEDYDDPKSIAVENTAELILEGMYGAPAASTQGNFIVEGMYGRPKYYVDGDILRENNQFGKPAYRIDGNYIREGMFGKPKYYIDGDLIRENNQFGKVVGRKKKI